MFCLITQKNESKESLLLQMNKDKKMSSNKELVGQRLCKNQVRSIAI